VIKAGIVGGTGYTGVELLRLLLQHPQVDVVAITSRGEAGQRVDQLFPNLRGYTDLAFTVPDVDLLAGCDVVFFATPHLVAMETAPALLARGVRVVDLSADYRLRDPAAFHQWYGHEHTAQDWLAKAVYGLPEMHREAIRTAQLVANPGCYPTASQLGLLPLVENRLVDTDRLVANCASGVSGAGRQASVNNLLAELSDSFKAYGVAGHRHLPEIEQGLADANGAPVRLTFVPHLLPTIRGIHATLYAELNDTGVDLQALFEQRYANEPFVDVLPAGSHPDTRSVRGANTCRIAIHRPQGRNTVVVLSVIDNLVKGAAGQAVQNMNLMFGLPETSGLTGIALLP
jgi:N-acetyl-gamma-glutamyl-phosphate reductase